MRNKMIYLMMLCIFLLSALSGCASQQAVKPDMKAEVSAILKENPEIIIDVLKKNSIAVYDIVVEGQENKQKMAEIQRRT
ncbi:MAG: hypothetical protein C0408_11695, partial [Odoribacter sp.]|nr:hypothetical protein [Odoribacter sp.]